MSLTVLSGLLALATTLLFGARFVMRKSVTVFDLFTVLGGHLAHGLAMVYMALVMLGMNTVFGWSWISYFFGFFAFVFVLRLLLVARVEAFRREPLFGFEQKSKTWWELLHIANHVAMAYMFLDMSYWNEVATIWAIASSAALLILGASNWIGHSSVVGLAYKPYTLFGDLGHVTMALSMIIMFGVMQWGLGGTSSGHTGGGHASVSEEILPGEICSPSELIENVASVEGGDHTDPLLVSEVVLDGHQQ